MTFSDNISFQFMPICNGPFPEKLSQDEKTFDIFALTLQPGANVAMAVIAKKIVLVIIYLSICFFKFEQNLHNSKFDTTMAIATFASSCKVSANLFIFMYGYLQFVILIGFLILCLKRVCISEFLLAED